MRIRNKRSFSEADARPGRIVISIIFIQFLLHLFYALISKDPRLLMPHLVAWLHDLFLLSLSLFLTRVSIAVSPLRMKPVVTFIFTLAMIPAGLLLSIYPQMLREYLSFPVNLFAGSPGSLEVLLGKYLGVDRLLPALITLIVCIALVFNPKLPESKTWCRGGLIAGWSLLLVGGLVTLSRSPHPVFNSIKNELEMRQSGISRAVPELLPASSVRENSVRIETGHGSFSGRFSADHVWMIVLEGVTADDFENEFLHGNHARFYHRVAKQAVYFERYYTTNLDSYTSLIAMLTSEQVPYRSYTDTGLYDAVNSAPNLVRDFRRNGYHSLFLSTYADQPFVPVRNDWSRIMHRGDLPSGGDWVSVESGRMESATEDRAALPELGEIPARYQRTFILHELAYGHTTAWRARTGIPQLAYYDRYLNELLDRLEANGSWPKSLLVIVSDHGDRSKPSKAGNYRVPLLVAGSGVSPERDAALRSHLDFRRIVNAYMTGDRLPQARKQVTVVGSTERWVYGEINDFGASLFIDDRTGKVIDRPAGTPEVEQLHRKFQQMINVFGSRFSPR